jgi:hypothetical protein
MKYKVLENGTIERQSDGALIPDDPANMDYRDYLRWRETGLEDPEIAVETPPGAKQLKTKQ